MNKERGQNRVSYNIFLMLCIYLVSTLILSFIIQILNCSHIFFIVEIISVIVPVILLLRKRTKSNIVSALIYLMIVLLLPFIASRTYDITVDGNSYHKPAIAYIKNGWNPLYETMDSFSERTDSVKELTTESRSSLWIEHYPKSAWTISAAMYSLSGNIESGKAFTWILIIMALLLAYDTLSKIVRKKAALVFSLLLALNPITLAQFNTFYVDAAMGLCFLMELLLLFQIDSHKYRDKKLWFCLAAVVMVFSNLKFTGLVFSGIIATIFFFYWIIINRKQKNKKQIYRNIFLSFTAIFLASIGIIGANSYIKNTIEHHQPLYPLVGDPTVDIVTYMQPKEFNNMSFIKKKFYSLFSRTANVTYADVIPQLKNPLRVYFSELEPLSLPDTRIGGFGPWFALATIVTTIFLVPALVILVKNEKQSLKYILLTAIPIIISIVTLSESWWARYVPQEYFLVIGSLLLAYYASRYVKHKKIYNSALSAPFLIVFINMAVFICAGLARIIVDNGIYSDIVKLKQIDSPTISIPSKLTGYEYTLDDNGVNYILVDDIPDEQASNLYSYMIELKNE